MSFCHKLYINPTSNKQRCLLYTQNCHSDEFTLEKKFVHENQFTMIFQNCDTPL